MASKGGRRGPQSIRRSLAGCQHRATVWESPAGGDLTWRRGAPTPHGAFQPAGSCRGRASPPGTTARTTRLGGTETGWRLNRKWERGFQKRRQQIINLLINSSGPVGGKGLSHCRAEAGGGGLKPLASSRPQLVIPKCQMQGTAGPAGSVFRPASPTRAQDSRALGSPGGGGRGCSPDKPPRCGGHPHRPAAEEGQERKAMFEESTKSRQPNQRGGGGGEAGRQGAVWRGE